MDCTCVVSWPMMAPKPVNSNGMLEKFLYCLNFIFNLLLCIFTSSLSKQGILFLLSPNISLTLKNPKKSRVVIVWKAIECLIDNVVLDAFISFFKSLIFIGFLLIFPLWFFNPNMHLLIKLLFVRSSNPNVLWKYPIAALIRTT